MMWHFKKLAKLALIICAGSFLVNVIYRTFLSLGVKRENKIDLQMYHLGSKTSSLMIHERFQPSDMSIDIYEDTIDKDQRKDTNINLMSSNSFQHKISIQSRDNTLSIEADRKEKISESNPILTTKGTPESKSSLITLGHSPSDTPSEKTQEVTGEKPRRKSEDGKKDKRKAPEIVDKVDDFHEDVLKNEIWNLDDIFPTAKGAIINYCPDKSPLLIGELAGIFQDVTKDELVRLFPEMEPGGRLRPSDCVPRQRLAIILPYRNRYPHLHITLHNLIPILHRQQADVTFFVVEQAPLSTFNKGALLNAGFIEANKLGNFDCFILHDVDLIPLNDFNLYRCDSNPRHYAVSIDKYNFTLFFPHHFGGVVGFARDHYLKVNGNSNLYLGWGGEDDDFRNRLINKKFTIQRYPLQTARYSMIKHQRDKGNEINPLRNAILKSSRARQDVEGLNTVRYKVLNVTFEHLYTWITVSINNTEILQSVPAATLADIQKAKKKWISDMAMKRKKQKLNNNTGNFPLRFSETNLQQ